MSKQGRKDPGAYLTIAEAAAELGLPAYVLRFWESCFSQLRPTRREGNPQRTRRYYSPKDIDLLRGLRQLLHVECYRIAGVQRILEVKGVGYVRSVWREKPKVRPQTEGESPTVAA